MDVKTEGGFLQGGFCKGWFFANEGGFLANEGKGSSLRGVH
jgi:hypothetical protein